MGKQTSGIMGIAVASVLLLNIFTFGSVASGQFSTENFEQNIAEGFGQLVLPNAAAQETSCGSCPENVVEVVVKKNVDIDFKKFLLKGGTNINDVKCNDHGGELCDYFTAEADINTPISEWKAVFNLGDKKLVVEKNKKIKVKKVHIGGNPHVDEAPSLEIFSTCKLLLKASSPTKSSGKIEVEKARNVPIGGGHLLLAFDDGIRLDGKGYIKNISHGKEGIPGPIVLNSCREIFVSQHFKIQTIGGNGGGDIAILTSGIEGDGDITINGLVRATHAKGLPPSIEIFAQEGSVSIDGTTKVKGVSDSDPGVQTTSGVQIRDLKNVGEGSSAFSVGEGTFSPPGAFDLFAGQIDIFAKGDVSVVGRELVKNYKGQYSALGINPHTKVKVDGTTNLLSSQFGQIHVTSQEGDIVGVDRAFGFFSGDNILNEIILLARNLIDLSVTTSQDNKANDNTKPLLRVQGGQIMVNEGSTSVIPGSGDGGLTEVRSFDGSIIIGDNSQVLANNLADGLDGENHLKSCVSLTNDGEVNPADEDPADDSGNCLEGP